MWVYGHSVRADTAKVQQMIGVCSQQDLLWDDLTAQEHLIVYAALKGHRVNAMTMLRRVGLDQVRMYEAMHTSASV